MINVLYFLMTEFWLWALYDCIQGSTHFHYKRNRRFIGQAEKMLREIWKS